MPNNELNELKSPLFTRVIGDFMNILINLFCYLNIKIDYIPLVQVCE